MTGHRWIPPQTASDTCFDVFLDVSLNIRVRVIWDAVKYMCIFPRIYELRLWWHQPSPWWRQNVETVSALLVFCEGKPPMIDGLPGHAVLWSFFLLVCTNPSIIWDALTVMWLHCQFSALQWHELVPNNFNKMDHSLIGITGTRDTTHDENWDLGQWNRMVVTGILVPL